MSAEWFTGLSTLLNTGRGGLVHPRHLLRRRVTRTAPGSRHVKIAEEYGTLQLVAVGFPVVPAYNNKAGNHNLVVRLSRGSNGANFRDKVSSVLRCNIVFKVILRDLLEAHTLLSEHSI